MKFLIMFLFSINAHALTAKEAAKITNKNICGETLSKIKRLARVGESSLTDHYMKEACAEILKKNGYKVREQCSFSIGINDNKCYQNGKYTIHW